MDCVVDTNIILRAADRVHPMSGSAKQAMVALVRKGHRPCITRQSLIEAWVVATRPRNVNGHGYSASFAAQGIARIKRLFHVLADDDAIYAEWERLVLAHQVHGRAAHDTRIVAAMNVHRVTQILTFNTYDFKRYIPSIEVISPAEVVAKHQDTTA